MLFSFLNRGATLNSACDTCAIEIGIDAYRFVSLLPKPNSQKLANALRTYEKAGMNQLGLAVILASTMLRLLNEQETKRLVDKALEWHTSGRLQPGALDILSRYYLDEKGVPIPHSPRLDSPSA